MDFDRYQHKPFAYSSHALIMDEFDAAGDGRRVLDVGCGRGYLARILTGKGYKVTGMDVSQEDLAIAAQWCCEVIHADAETCHFPTDTEPFDYILLGDVVEHQRDPLSLMRRLIPFLGHGGIVIMSIPNVAHLYMRLMLLLGRWDYADRGILDRTHLRFFTKASVLYLLDEARLELLRIRPTSLPWPMIKPSSSQRVQSLLISIDHAACVLWPTLFAYQWVISAKKGD